MNSILLDVDFQSFHHFSSVRPKNYVMEMSKMITTSTNLGAKAHDSPKLQS